MAAQKGRLFLWKVSDGTSPGNFTTVSGLQVKTLRLNNEPFDVTTADEAPFRQLMTDVGLRSLSFSGNGIYKDDAAVRRVEDLAYSGELAEYQLIQPHGDIIQCTFLITSFEYTAQMTSALTFAVTAESSSTATLSRL